MNNVQGGILCTYPGHQVVELNWTPYLVQEEDVEMLHYYWADVRVETGCHQVGWHSHRVWVRGEGDLVERSWLSGQRTVLRILNRTEELTNCDDHCWQVGSCQRLQQGLCWGGWCGHGKKYLLVPPHTANGVIQKHTVLLVESSEAHDGWLLPELQIQP